MQYFKAIGERVEFRFAPLGSVSVVYDYILNLHIIINCVNRHFRLYLESRGQYGECLDKPVAERTESRHDILYLTVKQTVDAASYNRIAEIVERSLILCKVSG